MANEQEEGDSTALMEPTQEIASEESNVVTEEEPSDEGGSDNMSLSELTTQLLAKGEEQEEGEADTTEEAVVEEEPDLTEENPKIEQPGLVAQTDEGEVDKKLLLDQYGLNLDAMSEEQAMSLGRALRTESLKRFGRLTAQKREAEAKVSELESKATDHDSHPRPGEGGGDPMSDVWTQETLTKKETDLQAIEDWAEDALQSEAQYDDGGEEYMIEADGKRYTKQDLLSIRSNTRKMLRKGGSLDKRQQFLVQRQQHDGEALQYFPWMSDEQSAEFMEYQQFTANPKYRNLLDMLEEANVFAGLLVEGNKSVKERLRVASNGSAKAQPKEKAIMPALASSAAPKRMPLGDGSRIQKEVNQAKKQFENTGSIQSLARLRELQGQMS